MIGGHERNAPVTLPRTSQLGDGRSSFAEQAFCGAGTQSDQDLRLDQIDLAIEPGNTTADLVGSGFPIAGRITRSVRSALKKTRQKNRLPTQTHRDEDFGEQFARRADKRVTAEIFLNSRSLTDKKDFSMTVTGAKNHRMTRNR